MITIKRALKSLIRQPLKSTLLLIILLVLLNAMAASIAIREESHQAIRRIDEGLGRVVTLGHDLEAMAKFLEKLRDYADDPNHPYAEDYQLYTDADGNVSWYVNYDRVRQREIDRIHTMGSSPLVETFSYQLLIEGLFELPSLKLSGSEEYEATDHSYKTKQTPTLVGVHRTPLIETEHSNAYITEGRQLTEEEMRTGAPSCIISKELAELNNLKPGDTLSAILTPVNTQGTPDSNESNITKELTIIGIIDYQKPAELFEKEPGMTYKVPSYEIKVKLYNQIIVPNNLVLELQKKLHKLQMQEEYIEEFPPSPIPIVHKPFFILKDPSDIPVFKADYQHLLKEDHMIFLDNRYRYDLLTSPLESAASLADNALLFSIIAAISVATLVLFFYLRERRHEIGILLSLGLKKRQLVLQLLMEVLIITLIALSITAFTGQALGRYITEESIRDTFQENKSALNTSIYDDAYKYEAHTMDFAERFITPEEVDEQFQVGFSPSYMLWLSLGALITAVLATLFSSYYIYSYSPRKILLQ